MTPALVCHVTEQDAGLDSALLSLARALQQGDRAVLVDAAGGGGTRRRLAAFAEGAAGRGVAVELLRVDPSEAPDAPAGWRLAEAVLAPGPVLRLTPRDLLHPPGWAALRRQLAREPDRAVLCADARFLAGPGSVLPAADGAAFAGGDPWRVRPDPRRIVTPRPDPAAPPVTELPAVPGTLWPLWEAWLADRPPPVLVAEPVLLRPALPDHAPEALALLDAAPRVPHRLAWAEHCLAAAQPERAEALLAEAERLMRRIGRRGRRDLAAGSGVLARLASGWIRDGRTGLDAALALHHATAARAEQQALTAEIRHLRQDIDLALPGPDYLRALYERLRLT